ncbi:MAG: ATP-binding protein, partial [Anaerolineae bacterium]|nr:ATP-binding protein [Anaerolineae bacterium]
AYESLSTLAREVVKNTRAIQGVITELRDLSTFNPRDLATVQRPIPANNLLWHVGAEWEPLARLAKIQVRVLFGPRGLYVLGDERRLRWALGNVVDNALKFSPPGTTITLAARHKDDHDDNRIEYIIKDEGYGIAADDLSHVFTRFYRGHPCDFDGQPVRKPGTGQGLFIARRVIESHGGEVSLASRVARGTTVIIRLPLTSDISFDLPDDDSDGDLLLDEIPAPDTSDTQPRETIIPSEDEFDTVRLEPRNWHEDAS